MKRRTTVASVLALVLPLLLVAPVAAEKPMPRLDPRPLVEANNAFACDLYGALRAGPGNRDGEDPLPVDRKHRAAQGATPRPIGHRCAMLRRPEPPEKATSSTTNSSNANPPTTQTITTWVCCCFLRFGRPSEGCRNRSRESGIGSPGSVVHGLAARRRSRVGTAHQNRLAPTT